MQPLGHKIQDLSHILLLLSFCVAFVKLKKNM